MRRVASFALTVIIVLAGFGSPASADGGRGSDGTMALGMGDPMVDGATTVDAGGPDSDGTTTNGSDGATSAPDAASNADSAAGSGGPDTSPVGEASASIGFGLAGPSRCATAGVAFCESFENGLDSTLWRTTSSGDGTAFVDDLHAARGTKALHVHTASGNGRAYVTETKSFPATSNILYGRMFVWLQDGITTSGHFTIAEGAGTGTPAVIRFGGQFKEFGVGSDRGASGDWTDHDTKPVPSQTWMCLEFEMKGDTNEFHVWWDDAERTALHRGAAQHGGFTMPAFNSLWFGWWMYNAVEPKDMWIDEIAVDFKPIGCAK